MNGEDGESTGVEKGPDGDGSLESNLQWRGSFLDRVRRTRRKGGSNVRSFAKTLDLMNPDGMSFEGLPSTTGENERTHVTTVHGLTSSCI